MIQSTRNRAGARAEEALRVEPLLDLGEIEPAEWDQLARRSRNVFATREWITSWWEVFGGAGSLLSFACRAADGRLRALLPMYVRPGRSGRELRFLGHGLADRLGPVCAPGDRPAAASALRRVMEESRGQFERFIGDDLPEQERWGLALGARTIRRTTSPLLRAPGSDWNSFLEGRSAHFRQQLRRREGRLVRDHALRYRLAEVSSRLGADVDGFFRLHEARWAGASRSFAGPRTDFHRKFAARALERGWLRLWIAEVESRPAAAWYGFRYAGAEWCYQAGRDRRYDGLSVGFVLLAHAIRAALDDGVGEYKLLRGNEPYKWRFANGDEPLETVTVVREDLERCPHG